MEKVRTERSCYWDNIKGFLMILTVFAHILYALQDRSQVINGIVDGIYMFHMPAFVFVSGYFGKSERSRSFAGIIRLVFLYFIFNSTVGFIYGFTSLIQPMYSYWYLVALIVWRLTAHHLARFKGMIWFIFLAALLCGFFPDIDNTFAASRIICFYPWYMAGYLLTEEKSIRLIKQSYPKRLLTGAGIAAAAVLAGFAAYSFLGYDDISFVMMGYSSLADALGRLALFVIAFLAICALRFITPDRNIPLITMFGRNSLWIFIIHRPFTLMISDYIQDLPVVLIMTAAVAGTLILCLTLGNDIIAKYLNSFLKKGAEIFTLSGKAKFSISMLALIAVCIGFVVLALTSPVAKAGFSGLSGGSGSVSPDTSETQPESETSAQDMIYPVMTDDQKAELDSAFRLTFAGDLILLEDQVKRGYNGSGYDFAEVFEYAKPYIESADLAVGVFEGPMAGEAAGYSVGNFDDGKELYLNYPDEFGTAVKNAGFDLVTTANNHLLDKGESGALRTIDVLDKIGLDHTGSYKSAEDKQNSRIKIVEQQGIRFAFLSYTYGCNNFENSDLIDGGYSYLTSVISGTEGEVFEKLKASVGQDFIEAKKYSPDLIVVLPHIGTQFSNAPDDEQKVWFEIFKENGADIILGDHPHAVEPVLIEEYNGRTVFTAYCPGNFANIYRDDQGDTSMLTEVYIDRKTKKIIGGSIVPLYTYAPADGNYRAVPIYDIVNDTALRKQLTTDDIARSANAHDIITEVVLGSRMDLSELTERYYLDENGFARSRTTGLVLTEKLKTGILYKALSKANSVCFIGDSVTEGTKNGGCPWYEPITAYLGDKTVSNYSKGGCTVSNMTEHAGEIPRADLYVIALGTNDVRYRDSTVCAMTPEEYVNESDRLRSRLHSSSPDAEFVFIAPWYSVDGDPFCDLSYAEKNKLNDEYSSALEKYCAQNGLYYINANPYIENVLKTSPDKDYLLDHIHPNASNGVIMYSEAVLSYA